MLVGAGPGGGARPPPRESELILAHARAREGVPTPSAMFGELGPARRAEGLVAGTSRPRRTEGLRRARPPCSRSRRACRRGDPGEPVLLEEFDRRAEEEAALCLATGGHLGDGLDEAAAETGDLVERALQARPGDALTAMSLVDEDAGDPPIRQRWRVLVVLAPVLDARELLRATVLAPALGGAVRR